MYKVNKVKARQLFQQGETIYLVPKGQDVELDSELKFIVSKSMGIKFDNVVESYIGIIKDTVKSSRVDYYYESNYYRQLCVWEGTLLGNTTVEEFEKYFKDTFDVRVKFAEEVITQPDLDDNGNPEPETGGRHDLLFYIHQDDISKFAVERLSYGIRWWEAVVSYNNQAYLYSKEILDKYPVRW
jgi:hypothetical protein